MSRSAPTATCWPRAEELRPQVIQAPQGKFPAAEDDGRTIRFWNPADRR